MEKAQISGYDLKTRAETNDKLTVQFNPETYAVSNNNSFDVKSDDRSGQRPLDFTFLTKKPANLTAELMFDTYLPSAPRDSPDVRNRLATLRAYTHVEDEKHQPPVIIFSWASLNFVGVLTSLKENYVMFLDTGTPVRVKAEITIQGCYAEDLAVKSNSSPDRTKIRTVCQRDTLWSIANREYGSPETWRAIALANGIENPRLLSQASELVIPALPGGGG